MTEQEIKNLLNDSRKLVSEAINKCYLATSKIPLSVDNSLIFSAYDYIIHDIGDVDKIAKEIIKAGENEH
ncbi:hypothetical protein [Streptococcus dysgalactiae]|uniref:hypothetical protein n=1 Tax=Streptococcus dysgalactiae TaxID=1334 RepID=UPI0024B67B6B|nr:hypothetical protein [Streptococcus dysgalactiae]